MNFLYKQEAFPVDRDRKNLKAIISKANVAGNFPGGS